MYAVIASGGKQYRVAKDDTIKVETIDAEEGSKVTFDKVLLCTDADGNPEIGTPYLSNVVVTGEVIKHGRHKKINILKFRRRKHSMKQMGHRQDYTKIKIIDISLNKAAKEK